VKRIARLFVRHDHAPPGWQGDAAAVFPCDTPVAVQRQDRPAGGGAGRRQRRQFCIWDGLIQLRVGKHFAQPGLHLPFLRTAQRGQVHPQRLGQLDEQIGGHGTLFVFDQVQVAGGDAEPAG